MQNFPLTALDRFLIRFAKWLGLKLPQNISAQPPQPDLHPILPPPPVVERVRLMAPLEHSIGEEIIDQYDQLAMELYTKIQKQLKRHKAQSQENIKILYDNQRNQAEYSEETRRMTLQARHAY